MIWNAMIPRINVDKRLERFFFQSWLWGPSKVTPIFLFYLKWHVSLTNIPHTSKKLFKTFHISKSWFNATKFHQSLFDCGKHVLLTHTQRLNEHSKENFSVNYSALNHLENIEKRWKILLLMSFLLADAASQKHKRWIFYLKIFYF